MKFAERFFKDAKNTHASSKDSIHISYRHFIEYFENCERLEEHNVVIGAFFTYGWMPKMLNLKGDLSNTVTILNKVKRNGDKLDEAELRLIRQNVNRSFIGTSKLLHFVRPDIHVIWDSKVCAYLQHHSNEDYSTTKASDYYRYLLVINDIINDSRFNSVHSRLSSEIGYSVEKTRIAEYVMYRNSPAKKK